MAKILIIEDDEAVRESLVDIVENSGFEALHAEDGQIAMEILKNEIPDLIISDIMMPRMDGIEFLKNIKENPETSMLPFIFLTAKSNYCDLREGMNYGADDYICKPFKAKELVSSINLRLKHKKKYNEKLNEIALNLTKYIPHELRTPLFPIIGFSDYLQSDHQNLRPNELIEIFGKINKSGHRLHKTIEKFLLYTEIELLKYDNEAIETFKNKTTQNIKPLVENIIKNKAAEFDRIEDVKFEILNCNLRISEDHFQFIVSELIENSLKFSQKNSPVEISCDVNENYFSISFKDSGIGMSNEQLGNSGPFIQHNRTIHNQDGIGLGLAITASMVKLYEGSMQIKSELNTSTTIKIKIKTK